MKKILAIALALVMMMSLAVFASAAVASQPDLDCSGWWTAHSEGIEVTKEGFTVTFTATAYDTADQNWHAPIFVLYGGSEAKVNGADYNEFWVHRADNYGWAGGWANFLNTGANMAELNALGVTVVGEYADGCWDNWVADMKAGQACTVTAKLEGTNAVTSITCHGVTNTITVPVDTSKPVYLSLSGELCTLTNIKITTPDPAPAPAPALDLTAMLKFADADFVPATAGVCPTTITGPGTYTLSVEDITATFGAPLDYAYMLYVEVEGGYAALKDLLVTDVKVVVDGEEIAVDQSKIWTYESVGADFLPNGNFCIEITNFLAGISIENGACIDPAIYADESLSITFTLVDPNPGTGDALFAVLAVFVASGMGLTAVISKKK